MKKFPVAAGIALALVAGSAIAADLPSMKAPPAYVPPPPVMSWNGLYGGVNIGYGFGESVTETGGYNYNSLVVGAAAARLNRSGSWLGSQSLNGVVGGGQIGYNWQFSPWLVLGFEADIQAADLNGKRDYIGPATVGYTAVNSSLNVDWFGTARGRVGFVMPSWPNLMVYGTGGFAYGQVVQQSSITNVIPGFGAINGKSTYDTTATGWTAGGGVEWMPLPAWSLKIEYLYTDLGSYSRDFAGVNRIGGIDPSAVMVGGNTGSVRWHTVRAGLNWHFNPFASAPILAKY